MMSQNPPQWARNLAIRFFDDLKHSIPERFRFHLSDADMQELIAERIVERMQENSHALAEMEFNRTLPGLLWYLLHRSITEDIGSQFENKPPSDPKTQLELSFTLSPVEKKEEALLGAVQSDHVIDALNQIRQEREEEYQVLVRFHVDGKRIPEIAEELNTPEGIVKNWLKRGRKRLQYYLDDSGPSHFEDNF